MHTQRTLYGQKGISLVELMISITIGLILMTGVVQLFLSSRTTFSTQQALARVQESGRLAMEFLAEDIRMAGYMGCMSRNLNFTNTLNNSGDLDYNFEIGIEGLDNVGATPPAGYPTDIVAGTDVLVVRGANGNGVDVTRNNDSAQLFAQDTGVTASCEAGLDSYSGLCENDILVVSDCSKARVFQATNLQASGGGALEVNVVHSGANATPGNAISSWGGNSNPEETFGDDSEIIKMNTFLYYIGNGSNGQPSLWQRTNGGTALELLEGVEDMQLTYGRDTSGDGIPDTYVDASVLTTAAAWEDISSVRVQLLIQSTEDNLLQEEQPYTFNGVTNAAPGDRRLRQVFINTVGIRSRLP
ncbi:PilW family protein [Microbulbifer agarilyticus]|uniref:PilW family protein n=1 Tax=Microbulbifer agarilyticus TaxID=260552 RepID=UPI001C969649|nr:PilW family protein [Microbulbifer agarilyticus]MBY6212859.1 PilW family protein [Microbulbifer agarilyticus]MCA0894430.1 PilW family protein [Microbulbifer agarilyticus]